MAFFLKRRSEAATVFILVTVALDALALGVMIPVLPKLVIEFEGGNLQQAASIVGIFGFSWAVMQFLFQPVLGALSDRFGRRPVVLLSNLGVGLDYIFMALAPSLTFLFVGRLINGLCAASFSTASAYITDVSPPEKRAGRLGMIGACFGLGFILGPAVGGVLGAYGLRLPFWAAAAFSLLNALYGYFVLPESLPPEKRTSSLHWRTANIVGSLRMLTRERGLSFLALAIFLSYLAHESLPSIFVLYTDYRYQWDARTTGWALALVGVAQTVVSGGLVRVAVPRFGERTTITLALGCGAAGFFLYAFAPTGARLDVGGAADRAVGDVHAGVPGARDALRGRIGTGPPARGSVQSARRIGDGRAALLHTNPCDVDQSGKLLRRGLFRRGAFAGGEPCGGADDDAATRRGVGLTIAARRSAPRFCRCRVFPRGSASRCADAATPHG